MKGRRIFASRQSGKFLLGWLVGVALGTALIGVGLFFGFNYLSTVSPQQTQLTDRGQPTEQSQRSSNGVAPKLQASLNDSVEQQSLNADSGSASAEARDSYVTDQSPAAPAPSTSAYASPRDGDMLPVAEGETIEAALDRRAKEQNLSMAIDRAVNAADRAAQTEPMPTDVRRQQQQQMAASQQREQRRQQDYEEQLRRDDAARLEQMRLEDQRRGIDADLDPDEEFEIAPRTPD